VGRHLAGPRRLRQPPRVGEAGGDAAARAGAAPPGARTAQPRLLRLLADRPFARSELVEIGGERWVRKRFRLPLAGAALAPLARALMRHELANCRRVEGIPGVAARAHAHSEEVLLREWVEGTDLRTLRRRGAPLPDAFFDELAEILAAIHARGLAYNDLEKKDNVLLTATGHPMLVDFQICLRRYDGTSRALRRLSGWLLGQLQRQDRRYLYKMKRRFRPDLLTAEEARLARVRPALARAYLPFWHLLHRLKRLLYPKGRDQGFRFSRRP